VKKTPESLYTKIELVVSHGIYSIDTFIEHTRLLHYVYKGTCNLNKAVIPQRDEDMFTPYTIESMDFEYVNLKPNETVVKRNKTKMVDHELVMQSRKNLKIAPVSNVFKQFINRIATDIIVTKLKIDLYYIIIFWRSNDLITHIALSENKWPLLGLLALSLLMFV